MVQRRYACPLIQLHDSMSRAAMPSMCPSWQHMSRVDSVNDSLDDSAVAPVVTSPQITTGISQRIIQGNRSPLDLRYDAQYPTAPLRRSRLNLLEKVFKALPVGVAIERMVVTVLSCRGFAQEQGNLSHILRRQLYRAPPTIRSRIYFIVRAPVYQEVAHTGGTRCASQRSHLAVALF